MEHRHPIGSKVKVRGHKGAWIVTAHIGKGSYRLERWCSEEGSVHGISLHIIEKNKGSITAWTGLDVAKERVWLGT